MIWDIWTENVKLGNWTNQGLCKPAKRYNRCITNTSGIVEQRRSCKNGRLNKCKDYELQRNVSCNASDGSSFFPCVGKKKDKKFQKKFHFSLSYFFLWSKLCFYILGEKANKAAKIHTYHYQNTIKFLAMFVLTKNIMNLQNKDHTT